MGLNTTHGCWHGSYFQFHRFRNALAEAGGYGTVRGGVSGLGPPEPDLPWDEYEPRNFQGEWDEMPADPLLVLLVHSDCDGVISAEHAGPLASRLAEIMPRVSPEFWVELGRFIQGLRDAAKLGEDVEFG